MVQLTSRNMQVLGFIREYAELHGYPPSIREIGAHLGVSGTLGVVKHLKTLERGGYLRRIPGRSRGLSLAAPVSGGSIPIVGTVRAGGPQPALQDIEGYFSIRDSRYLRGGTFCLRVKGDSMIDAHIQEGDLALVRPQPTAENRDIVVALVDGEATLKRFFRERNRIRLQPENPEMEPISIDPQDGEVLIMGKVVGIFRDLH
ncbi:MAG: transcriptional repressor LexA [Desulfobacteraceae bacterium]|nr:MAG: transcriptional repressor LexA [Desulfobacteraceae bacterium]